MKFLFSHRNFPGQFRHIIQELAKDKNNEIVFITGTKNDVNFYGVKKYEYKLKRAVPNNCHKYLRGYEESVIHGQAAAEVAIALKAQGFKPDIIYAHPWGNSMFFKDIFPNTPILLFCEWYYNARNSDIDFVNKNLNEDKLASIRCKNAQFLIELEACDKGICPTNWQKKQFPKIFHNKIEVLHDGIDTDYFVPNENAVLEIPNTNIKLSKKDKVVTYATRGMEPYRGFPQFMYMIEKLLKKRDDIKIVIGGQDRVCYGAAPKSGSYKELLLKKLDLDLSRVHFVGGLPYGEYKKLLQISSAHIYLTYPFVLSWSMLEAMSAGCIVIGSKTPPVEEVIEDNRNGLLVDFFNIDELLNQVGYVLDNQDKLEIVRKNARETIIKKYDLKMLLPRHIKTIKAIARMNYSS